MRVASIILLSLAAFCFYLAASSSLMSLALGWRQTRLAGILTLLAVISWVQFAICLVGGLACLRWRRAARRVAITVLGGALMTGLIWVSMGAALLSPDFDAVMPPGYDYPRIGHLLLWASIATLPLVIPLGWWLQRRERASPAVASLQQ